MKSKFLIIALWLITLPLQLWSAGTTWQTATALNQGASASGTLDDKTVEAWFKITVPEEGHVALTVTPGSNLSIQYMDIVWLNTTNNNTYVRQSIWPGSEKGTLDMTNAGKGTYYVHIKRSSGKGSYSLAYQFTACPKANDAEPNDENGFGSTLENGKTVEGRLGYRDAKDYLDQDDWYKLKVTKDGTVTLAFTPDKDYNLSIQYVDFLWYSEKDQKYHVRQSIWPGSEADTMKVTNAGVGTYYVHIKRSSGHGGYKLRYDFTSSIYANDAEPNDNERQGSTLEDGIKVQGHLGYRDAEDYLDENDWYKLQSPGDGSITLTIEPEQDYRLSIQYVDFVWFSEKDQKYYVRQSIWPGSEAGTMKVTNASVGTYYVHIKRSAGHGGYKLRYDFKNNGYTNDNMTNDEEGQGDLITNGQTMQGHLGYRDAKDYLDENDWYKLQTPKDGTITLTIEPEQEFNLSIQYVDFVWFSEKDQKYHVRQSIWPGSEAGTMKVTNAGVGTYYVHIKRSAGHGGYKLRYLFTANNYLNDAEPNDALEKATPLGNNKTLTGHLGYCDGNDKTDQDDWYKLDTKNTGVMLFINYERDTTSTLSIQYIDIVAQKGTNDPRVVKSTWPGTDATSAISVDNVEESTSYYVHIKRASGHGGYKLTFGAPERFDGSEIRIAYIGRNTTRLGIPSPFEVKVENIGSGHTGSFFIAMPTTPDIELLYAELPTEEGKIRVEHDEFAIYDAEEGDCGVFLMGDLAPYESYTFTVYAQGRISNASKASGGPLRLSLPDAQAFFGALKQAYKDVTNSHEYKILQEDGITEAVVAVCVDRGIFPEEKRNQYSQVIGIPANQLRYGYKAAPATPLQAFTQKVTTAIVNTNPALKAAVVLSNVSKGLVDGLRRRLWTWIYKDLGYIKDEPEVMDGRMGVNGIVRSWDPNEMCGPIGYGEKNYIGETHTVDYRIIFENKKEATAPAYRIRISDVLDEKVFDMNSVRFGSTSHDGEGYNWKMNREGNTLSWDIEGIELPPNVNAPEGEGYVTFSVDLKPGLANKTIIKNKASIIFDYNETIETNTYVNTLDLIAPTATMIDASQSNGIITITCSGSDDESGISHYLFFASDNDDDYQYIGQSKDPLFNYRSGNTDTKFYAIAVDNVGNTQTTLPNPVTADIQGIYADSSNNGTWTISTPNGIIVARGTGVPSLQLPNGLYIIRQGKNVRKVIVK